MKKTLLFLALGLSLFTACTKKTTDILPTPTATIEGWVTLHDEWGNVLPFDSINGKTSKYLGVKVSADSTSYSATTDSNGRWVIKGLPVSVGGTAYNFTFSKAGYGSYNITDVTISNTASTNPILVNSLQNINLYKKSSTTATVAIISPSTPNKASRDTTITVGPGFAFNPTNGDYQDYTSATNYTFAIPGSFKIGVTLNDSGASNTSPRGAVIYFSTKKTVSSADYEGYFVASSGDFNTFGSPNTTYSPYFYTAKPSNVYPYGGYSYGIPATTGIGSLSLTYPTGTTLYFIAYGYSTNNYNTNQYTNTLYGTPVFPDLGTPSTVVSFTTN